MSVLDDVDMDKLNEMLDKYKLPYNRKLEEYNDNILKIMRMQFPPTEELDDYDKKLQEEIKATEDYLVEHNEFLSKTMNYCGYISNKRKQVENRLAIIEKKFRKRFNPKVDKSFMEVMELKKEYDQIPEIKKKLLAEHHERMKELKNELEMTKAKTREYYYKEKDLLAEVASKDEKAEGIRKEIDEMNSKINEYHQVKERVETLENNEIPDLCKAIDAIKIEIKEQEELNADEINKFETNKSLYESVTEQINALEQDFENKCIQIRELQEMIQTITVKSTLFDLEVDERFQNIVNTEFFQQEKSRLLQLKVDNMSIASDINTYRNDVNEAKLEIQKLNEEIARDKLEEKNAQLKSELSQLVELEMDKMEETRQLKARLEAEKEAYFKIIENMENQITELNNRKIEIENITDAQVLKLIENTKKKPKYPIIVPNLGRKKFNLKAVKASDKQKAEGSPSKKLKLDVPVDDSAKSSKGGSPPNTGAIRKNYTAAKSQPQMEAHKSTQGSSAQSEKLTRKTPSRSVPTQDKASSLESEPKHTVARKTPTQAKKPLVNAPAAKLPVDEKSSASSLESEPQHTVARKTPTQAKKPPATKLPVNEKSSESSLDTSLPKQPFVFKYNPVFDDEDDDGNESTIDPNELNFGESEVENSMDLTFN